MKRCHSIDFCSLLAHFCYQVVSETLSPSSNRALLEWDARIGTTAVALGPVNVSVPAAPAAGNAATPGGAKAPVPAELGTWHRQLAEYTALNHIARHSIMHRNPLVSDGPAVTKRPEDAST